MLAKRIIPCLDVKDGVVVKGTQFRNHQVLGGILELAKRYQEQGADELIFYEITASAERRTVDIAWVEATARLLDIPFCVAGGIRNVEDARRILNSGADKISINSPAHERPELVSELATAFGSQCVVVGIDSLADDKGTLRCWQYTGSEKTAKTSGRETLQWVEEMIERGAGEIVLNTMSHDGTKRGYDIEQLAAVRERCSVPLVASGGAGRVEDFAEVFTASGVDASLAAGIFHRGELTVADVKAHLAAQGIEVRL